MYEAKGMFVYMNEGEKLFAVCYSGKDAASIANALKALSAIRARIDGDWDNPELKAAGPLGDDLVEDISHIVDAALAKARTA
jgi:hypothetical protein